MNSDFLFVYGTLLQNADNDMSRFLAARSKVKGKAYFFGKLYKISWFPGAILSDNTSNKVHGTCIKLSNTEATLSALDDYEGYDANDLESSLFTRQLVTIYDENGASYKAWVYLYNQNIEGETHIPSGDFLNETKP